MLVGSNQGHSDELLHSAHTAALSNEARNLATALVMGVLRWQIALDARIAMLLQRPDQRLQPGTAQDDRLGVILGDRAAALLHEGLQQCLR